MFQISEIFKNSRLCGQTLNNINIITNYKLPIYHRDPFDRFLIWESIRDNFILLSVGDTLTQYKKDGLKIVF